jgi:DNA-binding transcriptional MerR regulator
MKQSLFLRDDLVARFRMSHARLAELEKLKLIRPVGLTEDKVPVYAEDTVAQIEHIRKLEDLGYGLEEITRIVRKVGLPKVQSGKAVQAKPDQYLTVGTLAEKVGVSPRTIKHWEDVGILVPEMRSEGGFRLYPGVYIQVCHLIKDLQLFGYSLEEIKAMSDLFRDFLEIEAKPETAARRDMQAKLDAMFREIDGLSAKMEQFKKGIERWNDLLKKKRKEIVGLKQKNVKSPDSKGGSGHA